jgi:hypothetical protein
LQHRAAVHVLDISWSFGGVYLLFVFFFRRGRTLLIHFATAMVILYTLAPMLYRWASSAYFNLSLLSSDFFSLLFGAFVSFTASHVILIMDDRFIPLREP